MILSALEIATRPATRADLMHVDGKAELINGKIVEYPMTGFLPTYVAGRIFGSLQQYEESSGVGFALTDGIGYVFPELSSGRESFSPDVSYFLGPFPAAPMRFIEGSPAFAVEVRSENDYSPAALREQALKRADYFAAGTLVVWDVDPIAGTVAKFSVDAPTTPTLFAAGDVADAEPAVPGWCVAVARLMPARTD